MRLRIAMTSYAHERFDDHDGYHQHEAAYRHGAAYRHEGARGPDRDIADRD